MGIRPYRHFGWPRQMLRRGVPAIGWSLLAVAVIGLISLLALLPDVKTVLSKPIEPARTSKILAADGSIIMSYGRYYHQPVPLEKISPALVQAVLATEDRRFYRHGGLDPVGISRAVFRNLGNGGIREGGSTLTQQLARILFLSNERTWTRKLKEAVLAIRLERALSKRQILALYLNNVYFGEGAYGVEAASRVYLHKSSENLAPEEAALLAGLIQAPARYSPFHNPMAAKLRRNRVLMAMAATGTMTSNEAERLGAMPVQVNPLGRALAAPDKFPFFNRAVLQEALIALKMKEADFWKAGYRVHTTLDPKAQRIAQRQVRRLLSSRGGGPRQGGLISLDPRNRIIAYVGGRDFDAHQFDHIRLAHRQAGSLFKVFVYAAAFKQGMTPTTQYEDSYIRVGKWTPHNYDRRYHGRMTLARALIRSDNVIAVKVLQDVKPETVVRLAQAMGVRSRLEPNLSLALGAADITLEEMTGAFSVLRAKGVYRKPYAIERIEAPDGKMVYSHSTEERTVLDQVTCDTMVRVMREVMRQGTGRAANFGIDAAGKTGTSDEHRDAWFVGFTPEVTTGVWVGNDDNSKMSKVVGGTIPALIWRGYMAGLLAGREPHHFDLAKALPLDKRTSMRTRSPILNDEPVTPWAIGSTPLAERLAVLFENRRQHVSLKPKDGPGVMAERKLVAARRQWRETQLRERKPIRKRKPFKKLGKAWTRLKKDLRALDHSASHPED
jgi:penicillin-binding protein 1A